MTRSNVVELVLSVIIALTPFLVIFLVRVQKLQSWTDNKIDAIHSRITSQQRDMTDNYVRNQVFKDAFDQLRAEQIQMRSEVKGDLSKIQSEVHESRKEINRSLERLSDLIIHGTRSNQKGPLDGK